MTAAVRRRFITAEHERTLLREWDSLSLHAILSEKFGKSKIICLEEVVSGMHKLQSGPLNAYCNDDIFKNKLLNAVKDVDACTFTYFKPADTVKGLTSDFHSSLSIAPITTTSPVLDANFFDRRYKGKLVWSLNNSTPTQHHVNRIVYKNKECWSTNHDNEERLAALRSNRQIRQFFTDIENDDGEKGHPCG